MPELHLNLSSQKKKKDHSVSPIPENNIKIEIISPNMQANRLYPEIEDIKELVPLTPTK